ncbi:MAG TPA: hypothetical protein PLP17_16610, partial [Oligoflexia bacterium]|nr:hypothetical protein [Oligoflexia bacterium]
MRSSLLSLRRTLREHGPLQLAAAFALVFLLPAVSCKNSGTPPGAGRTPEAAVVAVTTHRIT